MYEEHDDMLAMRRKARLDGDVERAAILQEEIEDLKGAIARAEAAAVEEAPPPPRRPKAGKGKGGGWHYSDKRPRY